MTWRPAPAPVRQGRLPARLSPLGNEPTGRDASIKCGPSNSTGRCVGFVRCDLDALRPKGVKGGGCNCIRRKALLQEARALQQSEAFAGYRQRRVVMEHRLARLVQLGIR